VKFSDFINNKEPALDVFNLCHEIVFTGSDGNTEFIERIGPEARLVYLLWCFDGEIHNGGFDQLFFNSLGDHCLEILEGLKTIKANKSSNLLEKAMRWFPNSQPSPDRQERWDQLESHKNDVTYQSDLNDLDAEFYEYEDNLAKLLDGFVKNNKEASINA